MRQAKLKTTELSNAENAYNSIFMNQNFATGNNY